MRPEAKDQFLANLDTTATALGAANFDEGIEIARRTLRRLSDILDAIQTRELLAQTLDGLQISQEWEHLMVRAAENGLHILRWLAFKLHESADESLPEPPRNGIAVSGKTQVEILQYVNKLEFEQNVGREVAKQRTAKRFGCSVRTIERIWKDRKAILDHGPKYRFDDLVSELQRVLKEDAITTSHWSRQAGDGRD